MNKLTQAVLTAALATVAATAFAAQPVRDVSSSRHPNIAAAQKLTDKAYQRIVAAQQANEWDMDGHAAKAKDLLDQANRELKAAAEAANQNHK
ncbi:MULTISPECIES: hypothetical protein [Rhodanobacter]|uniref:DUF4398 domain-containing protein n=1 Tax=Rhodanobacter hydrolyticus TaxID=2250595 RepID=A0ABW8J6W6_9GAMM|nr:hypothetical protein [Rhodanobacter sp. 7MK24]MBD8881653.1 hypothetical protein [Rhodanobacter sp. 7MK24]